MHPVKANVIDLYDLTTERENLAVRRKLSNKADWFTGLLEPLGAIDNDRRLQILDWLKEPTKHFPPQIDGDLEDDGVCGVLIAEKLGVSQPTVSEHMRVLVAAGLVNSKRIKQWTFYKRNEKAISAFKRSLREAI